MSLYKRAKTWWTDFSVHGQRYRQTLDTSDWREAQRLEKELISQASQGRLADSRKQFARLPLSQAAVRYLDERVGHLAESSIRSEGDRLKPVAAFFKAVSLNRISADSVRTYIAHRKSVGVSNRTVNMEIGCLRRVLKRAKLWHRIGDDIRLLREGTTVEHCRTKRRCGYSKRPARGPNGRPLIGPRFLPSTRPCGDVSLRGCTGLTSI